MNTQNDSNILRMVDRACIILDYLYEMTEAASISSLSKELDLPKANVFRILYTLQVNGLVEKAAGSDLYRLGNKMIKYGEKVRYDFNIVDQCSEHMKALAKDIGETINLGIEHEGSIITLHSEDGEKSVLVSRLIPVADPHCSSMGKLYLSELGEIELTKYFETLLKSRTVNTITTKSDFKKEIPEILNNELAYDREEYEYGLSCIATPLRDSNKKMIAMISVSGPTTRLQFKGMDTIIQKLKETAHLISKGLT